MKIVVFVKECLELEEGFEIDGDRIDDRYFEHSLNEPDEYAVEEAVQLKESGDHGDVEVVVATVGPARTVQSIRKLLAMGADRAIRVWDEDLSHERLRDRHLKARILAGVVEAEEPDLIFAGIQSDDEGFGGTGVLLANEIGYAWAAAAVDVDVVDAEEPVRVKRELEGGTVETVEVTPPAVLTVQAGINEPRYVNTRTIYSVGAQKEISETGVAELGVDLASGREFPVTSIRDPEQSTTYIEGDADSVAEEIRDLLADEQVT